MISKELCDKFRIPTYEEWCMEEGYSLKEWFRLFLSVSDYVIIKHTEGYDDPMLTEIMSARSECREELGKL